VKSYWLKVIIVKLGGEAQSLMFG